MSHGGLDVANVEKRLNGHVVASARTSCNSDGALPLLVRKGSLTGHFAGARGQTPLPSANPACPLSH